MERIIRRTYHGVVTSHDMIESLHELARFQDGIPLREAVAITTDLTDATLQGVDFNATKSIARAIEEMEAVNPSILYIGIAPSEVQYGLARMFQGVSSHLTWETRVVRTVDEAEEILADRNGESTQQGSA